MRKGRKGKEERKYTTVDVRDIASVAVKVFVEGEPHFSKSYNLTTEV